MKSLSSLAAISIAGADARVFLQGQLSNDLQLLNSQQSLLASCNSAQGRVQAVLTLIERDDAIVTLLPTTMVSTTIARLRKYVLRSKVIINDISGMLRCYSATRTELQNAGLATLSRLGEHHQQDAVSIVRWRDANDERYLVLQPTTAIVADDGDEQWLLADIRTGLPQVAPQTHEAFVAQMLNLDVLDGISFNKGCYTGQEIIARAHFRGAVKRRMFRLSAATSPPAAATRILNQADQTIHAGEVVMSAATPNGCELLAVLNLNQQDATLCLETQPLTQLAKLALPYDLPATS